MEFTKSEKMTIERMYTMIKQNFEYLANDEEDEFALNEDLSNLKNIRNKMVSVNKMN